MMAADTLRAPERVELARVWTDPAFKQALVANPRPLLRQLGIAIPDDVTVKVLGSNGTPSDRVATLLQFVLDRGPRFSAFFMPSPLHTSAQLGAYGKIIGTSVDDPVFAQRLHADATAALGELGATWPKAAPNP